MVKFACLKTRNEVIVNAIALQKRIKAEKKLKGDKSSSENELFFTDDHTYIDMREKQQLKPLVESIGKEQNRPAYYKKGELLLVKRAPLTKS